MDRRLQRILEEITSDVVNGLMVSMNAVLRRAAVHIQRMYRDGVPLDDFIDGLIRWNAARLGVERYALSTNRISIERWGSARVFRCGKLAFTLSSIHPWPNRDQYRGVWATCDEKDWLAKRWIEDRAPSLPFSEQRISEDVYILGVHSDEVSLEGDTSWAVTTALFAPIVNVTAKNALILEQDLALDLVASALRIDVAEEPFEPLSIEDLFSDEVRDALEKKRKGH